MEKNLVERVLEDAVCKHPEQLHSIIDGIDDLELKKKALTNLLFIVSKYGLADHSLSLHLFREGEKFGAHILPVHFYNPIPNTGKLPKDHFSKIYDLKHLFPFEDSELLKTLQSLSEYTPELKLVPKAVLNDSQGIYYFDNGQFGSFDATVYYGLIRKIKPSRIVEVGAGFSTLLAKQAAKANKNNTKIQCIEPYPRGFLKSDKDIELIQLPVQEVPIEIFSSLKENDILFIDNTHVSKIGSDVNDIFFRILPAVPSGVFVHLHDIFLPNEYPESWVRDLKLFWNEQYMLLAYLSHNKDYRPVMFNAYLSSKYPTECTGALPVAQTNPVGGSSFWMKRQ
jgi:hypothetical protein